MTASRWCEVRRGNIPHGPGTYVVYQDGKVVYVGSTTNLKHRVRVYFTRNRPAVPSYDDMGGYWKDVARPFCTPWGFEHDGTRIRVKVKVSRRLGDWLMWEWRLISRLQPKYNRAGIN
jgi:excinuclease UvrABC nuclease subunit